MQWLEEFHGPNAAFAEQLWEEYRRNPSSVDGATRAFFEGRRLRSPSLSPVAAEKAVAAAKLADAIRSYGYLEAELDPLGKPSVGDPTLSAEYHGLNKEELEQLPAAILGEGRPARADNAWHGILRLRELYCEGVGFDFNHLRDPAERAWLQAAIEGDGAGIVEDSLDRVALLRRLTQVETFEQFLHRVFPGKHRFSIEGLDMLVPMLDAIIADAQDRHVRQVLLGMAHRGRLNVMAHILGMPYEQILAGFKDPLATRRFLDDLAWTGDVKYHRGATRAMPDGGGSDEHLTVALTANPSHVEAINPVIEGRARAAGSEVAGGGAPEFDPGQTLPVLIHGDAAFAGQGVVAETLNLAGLHGYRTGGTLHLLANNQLGYTTEPEESRSTLFASDLAKGFKIPIVHVNADDPTACLQAIRLACAYRAEFQKDFLVDLIGYRRYGHNEGDEPSFTQPVLYEKIRNHPTIREQWAEQLVAEGQVAQELPSQLKSEQLAALQEEYQQLEAEAAIKEAPPEPPPPGAAAAVATAVDRIQLAALNRSLLELPEDFQLHRKLSRVLEGREGLFEDDGAAVDWSTAEQLAWASILAEGTAIRVTGEDVERGTFSQRHAVFHDAEDGERFVPLQALPQAQASFEIHNSPLTENAALAFEYGYDIESSNCLVIWEAQYGDFINGAQVPVDEFVVSARAKWGIEPALVLLLPHGYEGAGPDHSSARVERFLQLAAEGNMRVANCTTAAQYFHLLRRQAALLEEDPLPLVVLTPKSLLRHRRVASEAEAFDSGRWQPVIRTHPGGGSEREIRKLLLCSGKIAIDLLEREGIETYRNLAILRLEGLAPFPRRDLEEALSDYGELEEVLWVQEEPKNMGPWPTLRHQLADLLGQEPSFVGRPPSSSPAEGSAAWHSYNQEGILERALAGESKSAERAVVEGRD